MADLVVEGIQLPPDEAGKITAGFILQGTDEAAPDATTGENTILIPASAIVDQNGVEIGSRILSQLEEIVSLLERIENYTCLSTAALTE